MPKAKGSGEKIIIKATIPFEITKLPVKRAASLAYLDVEKLSRAAKAEFVIGQTVAGKSSRDVRAVVRKGMVVALEMEGCSDCKPMKLTPELKKVLNTALRKLNPKKDRFDKPIPVREFLAMEPEIDRSHCFSFCFLGYCIQCCWCCGDVVMQYTCHVPWSEDPITNF